MTHFTKIFLFFVFISFSALKTEAQSVGGTTSGAVSYCPDSIKSGFLSLVGYVGNIQNWMSSTDGVIWTTIFNNQNTQAYPKLTQTTCYRAVVQLPSFPPDTSTTSCITIFAPSVGGTIGGGGTFCGGSGGGTLNLTGKTGNVLYWQYSTNGGTSWTNVSNTTTSLIYTNITQSTLYRAVVQSGTGCQKDTSSQASFIINPLTVAGTISSSDTVCYGTNSGTLNLIGNVGSVLGWLYSADNGATWVSSANTTTSQTYSGLVQTRWYKAIVRSASCSIDTTAVVKITVLPLTPVSAGNDTSIVQGKSVTLNGSGVGTPLWTPSAGLSSTTILNPVATPVSTTSYVLMITDSNQCIYADTVLVTLIVEQFEGTVSNLFTPNGDGINDTWYIQDIQNYPENEVFVYNIYGNEVYTKKGYMNEWEGTYNGSPLPDGTYFYVLKLNKPDQVVKGSVDILKSK